ncbi:MAG: TIGR00282 family metallophosphoesterase [Clostridia bacterium]|nr:TIGR00282 family metallophosphoesterase [Clostridia bacterium]
MRVLCVGDVCSPAGCAAALDIIPNIKREYDIDFTIVNGENSAEGNGITPYSADLIFSAGADVITGGNHSFRRKEIYETLDSNPFILRPDNIKSEYGSGYVLYDFGKYRAAVINLSGQVYLERVAADNAFRAAQTLVDRAKYEGAVFIFVDFHAEATSEKRAMGFFLDGKVSVVFGTHTHIQTADEQILPGGTGYITDLGMTGVIDSVLGVQKEIIINRLISGGSEKFLQASGKCMLNGCIFDVDDNTGLTRTVERIYREQQEG